MRAKCEEGAQNATTLDRLFAIETRCFKYNQLHCQKDCTVVDIKLCEGRSVDPCCKKDACEFSLNFQKLHAPLVSFFNFFKDMTSRLEGEKV